MKNADGSEPKLARVSYLPGVVPPSEPVALADEVPVREVPVREALADAMPADGAQPPETVGERSARAHNVSMHALTRRGLSSAEMTTLLRSRDLDSTDIEIEVARLEEVGLLDDRELAGNLVRTLQDRKGLGRSAITAELRRRKVDSVAIEEALSELDGDDELSRAREIAMKRAPQLRSLDAETARRRLGAFLMRKGYSGSVVSSAVASALASNTPSTRGPRFQ